MTVSRRAGPRASRTRKRWCLTALAAYASLSHSACGSDDPEHDSPSSPVVALDGSITNSGVAALPDSGLAQPADAGALPGSAADGGGVAPPGTRDAGTNIARDAGQPPTMPTTPAAGTTDISKCSPPPEGAPDKTVQAWMKVNQIRVAAGSGCMNMAPPLNKSAQAHCDYKVANRSMASCAPDAHTEVMSCSGFTGATAQDREIAAGYARQQAYTEVANTYGNNPTASVQSWVDTVWHRIPLLDPWITDMGYGGAAGCDVIDIGRGTATTPANTVVVYPYDGQTNVPPTFNGVEGPAPPPPAGGWPSAYPINIYAQRISVTEHVLTKDGDSTPIEHLWLDAKSPEVGGLKSYFTNTVFMYGAPFELSTKYHVKIVGTYAGGALNVEWSFTTAARRPFGT